LLLRVKSPLQAASPWVGAYLHFLSHQPHIIHTAWPWIWGWRIIWCDCLYLAFTGTHCAYPQRDDQNKLADLGGR